MKITIDYKPSKEDQQFLLDSLHSSNDSKGMAKSEDCWVFANDDENKIIGGCKFLIFSKMAWVAIIWVEASQQGKGYGKKLLETMEKEAKRKGCSVAALDTLEFQKAVPFYEKCGYQLISTVEALNGHDERYFMKKNL